MVHLRLGVRRTRSMRRRRRIWELRQEIKRAYKDRTPKSSCGVNGLFSRAKIQNEVQLQMYMAHALKQANENIRK